MRALFSILLLAFSLSLPGQAEESKLRYRIEAKTFESGEADIRKVLEYTARPLWKNFPGYKVEPMVITKSNSGPIVIFQRNARQEIVVKLDTHKTYWRSIRLSMGPRTLPRAVRLPRRRSGEQVV